MTISAVEADKVYRQADCLHDRQAVQQAIAEMGQAIAEKLAATNPLVLVVMNGALIPAGYLLTYLDFPLQIDYIHATRYRGKTSGGELHWLKRPSESLEGRVVLIIDDILDEGATLKAIIEDCRQQGATAVYSAVLVEKRHQRKNGCEADFVGLEVEDRYVFGFGMDYKEYLRNAPGIYAVAESG